MSESDADRVFDELDRLINDPDVRMDAARVWALLDRISGPGQAATLPAG